MCSGSSGQSSIILANSGCFPIICAKSLRLLCVSALLANDLGGLADCPKVSMLNVFVMYWAGGSSIPMAGNRPGSCSPISMYVTRIIVVFRVPNARAIMIFPPRPTAVSQ